MSMFGYNKFLREFNTFGIEVSAKAFARVQNVQQLIHILMYNVLPVKVLGGGSNILLTQNVNALVIKNEIGGISIFEETHEEVILEIGAGVMWHDLVLFAIEKGYGGIENLSLIPGTVGAAPIQNIGAYGVELKDVFVKLEALNLASFEVEIFDNSACDFGYRESIFKREAKDKYFIIKVFLRLSKTPTLNLEYGDIKKHLAQAQITMPTIRDVSNAVITIRQSKLPDPKLLGNAGSFFKNPQITLSKYEQLKVLYAQMPMYQIDTNTVKIPAGWLIEQCGFKGKRYGDCGSHAQQALVIVNYGNATGHEIKALAELIIETVKIRFGIDLQMEVNVW